MSANKHECISDAVNTPYVSLKKADRSYYYWNDISDKQLSRIRMPVINH